VGGTEPGEPLTVNRQSGQSGTASNLHLAIHFTVQTTIRFAIKAAVEFVARGALNRTFPRRESVHRTVIGGAAT
jgi:hypothetical protein